MWEHSQGRYEHKPMNNVGNSSRGRCQESRKFSGHPCRPYRAHCAVIFAIAQLSCFVLSVFVDSAPARSLLFFVVDSVCMFVTLLQIDSSFLLLHRIAPFFGRQFSVWHSTKRFSSIFDLGPLTPKIDSPKCDTKSPITRLV